MSKSNSKFGILPFQKQPRNPEGLGILRNLFFLMVIVMISGLGCSWKECLFVNMRPEKKIVNSLGIEFPYIPPGKFMMGSPLDERGRWENEILHPVTLTKGFYLQTTEVTQGQWKAVMGNNPSLFTGCGDNCPVENVSWDDVQEFIKNLNKQEGTNKYRLPTEAEWEYACRAGSATVFANGGITELYCGIDPNFDAIGWYCGNSDVTYSGCSDEIYRGGPACAGTHPAAQKLPNSWGLYDMNGNVWEWCADCFDDYRVESVIDPSGPCLSLAAGVEGNSYRVVRGGGWKDYTRDCRAAYRSLDTPGGRYDVIGFRLARSL
jgi:formylglycine-generating enzyme required for sulfatase activity